MSDNHETVCLVTGDDTLRQAMEAHRPPGLALRCIIPDTLPSDWNPPGRELWIDLDHTDGLPQVPSPARVYFHSRRQPTHQQLPPGLFIRKPCTETVARVLWARLGAAAGRRTPAVSAPAAPGLPSWALEFHELGLRELCRKCVNRLGPRLGYADASLYLCDADEGVLTLAETTHHRPIDLAVPLRDDHSHLMVAVARTGRLLVTSDAGARWQGFGLQRPQDARRYIDGSCLIAPLASGGRLWGILNLSRSRRTKATEVGVPLRPLVALISRSLRYARAYDRARTQARVDPLTGLYNHRWMMETLIREVRRCQRSRTPLAAIMADLDGLKEVNDHSGHSAGDCLLRHIAGRITAALRQSDSAARVGGDEFVMLLPATDLEGAAHVAQRVLDSIRTDAATFRGAALPIRASLGVAQWQPNWDAEQLLEAADKAMYQAKQKGGNRVTCWPYDATAAVRFTPAAAQPWPTSDGVSQRTHHPSPLPAHAQNATTPRSPAPTP
ncbi:MAG: sensor domain-containing diguanylate cyclase [Phycisphaerae bacterium]|jgi:diguanylate cyclase (GGDEF)-like protein